MLPIILTIFMPNRLAKIFAIENFIMLLLPMLFLFGFGFRFGVGFEFDVEFAVVFLVAV